MLYKELTIKDPLGDVKFLLPENCCVFCKHCTDFFYDYTNGPYLRFCDINHPNIEGTCELFEENKEIL